MVALDDYPYWVKQTWKLFSSFFQYREQKDTLFLTHIDLENINLNKADLGATFLIKIKLNETYTVNHEYWLFFDRRFRRSGLHIG